MIRCRSTVQTTQTVRFLFFLFDKLYNFLVSLSIGFEPIVFNQMVVVEIKPMMDGSISCMVKVLSSNFCRYYFTIIFLENLRNIYTNFTFNGEVDLN